MRQTEHEQRLKLVFFRQNVSQRIWWVSSWLDLLYIHRKQKQTRASCWPKAIRVSLCFLWTCWRLNKLETCQMGKTSSTVNQQVIKNLLSITTGHTFNLNCLIWLNVLRHWCLPYPYWWYRTTEKLNQKIMHWTNFNFLFCKMKY